MPDSGSYDYIVVGGGSAGCIVAANLSADARHRVLVLEAGGRDHHPLLSIPIGVAKVWNRPATNWNYSSEPEPHADGRRIFHPRGKVLGGSAAINMMAYVRGHAGDYDRWAQAGLRDWSYARVLPYFRRCETWYAGADDYRGGSGPIQTQPYPSGDPIVQAWRDAGRSAGFALTDDYNGRNQEGFDRFQFNIGQGRRANSARRYLRPALTRPNLTLETGALVHRVRFDGTRAVGVDYEVDGQARTALARAEVILSAGAYNSPQILMRSGVGPADDLHALGIPVVADRSQVGRNLHDHPASGVDFVRPVPGPLHHALRMDRLAVNLARAWFFGTGSATIPLASGTAFVKSAPERDIPDIQLLFRAYSPDMEPWLPGVRTPQPDGVGLTFCHLRPEARGRVSLASADPHVAPLFVNNFLDNEVDRRAMRDAFKIARRVLMQPAFDGVRGDERLPGAAVQSDDDIDTYIRASVRTVFHPCGTCRMGVDEASVVDPELRVRGVAALRVIDAAVMPDVVGGNINAAVMMIAEKGSDMVLSRPPLAAAD